jgi:hypothetical protein
MVENQSVNGNRASLVSRSVAARVGHTLMEAIALLTYGKLTKFYVVSYNFMWIILVIKGNLNDAGISVVIIATITIIMMV